MCKFSWINITAIPLEINKPKKLHYKSSLTFVNKHEQKKDVIKNHILTK